MDKHTQEFVIAVIVFVVGAFMAFNERHYHSSAWHPDELTKKVVGAEGAKRLAKFYGRLLMIGATIIFLQWMFW